METCGTRIEAHTLKNSKFQQLGRRAELPAAGDAAIRKAIIKGR